MLSGSCVLDVPSDGLVRLFDVRDTRTEVATPTTLPSASHFTAPVVTDEATGPLDLYSVVFHPSGRHILAGGFGRRLLVWDVETGQCLHSLSGHTGAMTSAAVHPMGQLVFTGCKVRARRLTRCRETASLH